MDVEKEIAELKAKVSALEARVRFQDAADREERRQRHSASKAKSIAEAERLAAVDMARSLVVPLLASVTPEHRAQIMAEEPDVAAMLRKLPDVIPGIDDAAREGMRGIAAEATRLGLTWGDLGIGPDGLEVRS